MAESLLMSIARENFGRTKYLPVLHGRSGSIQPTTLIIKQNRAWWKKPFHHSELRVLSKLEKYVDAEHQKWFRELAEGTIVKSERKLQKKEIAEVSTKHEITLSATENAAIECSTNCNLGDLELGMMDEEYYEDTDMRSILDSSILCKDKMEPYMKHKLYIVTSVVYSSMFKIIGKREERMDIKGQLKLKTKLGGWVSRIGSVGGKCSSVNCKAAMVSRKKKAPIFFTVCPVKYDESSGKLKIPKNQFVGNVVARGLTCDSVRLGRINDSIENLMDAIEDENCEDDGEIYSEILHMPDLESKLETIKHLLLSVQTRSERETLINKYLFILESLLNERGGKCYVDSAYHLDEDNERGILKQFGLQLSDSELAAQEDRLPDLQDFGLLLKFIAGRSEEEIDLLEIILHDEKEAEDLKMMQNSQ